MGSRDRGASGLFLQRVDGLQNVVGAGSVRDRFADFFEANDSVLADHERARHGDFLALHCDSIRKSGLEPGIREQRKPDAELTSELHRVFGTVDADRDERSAALLEFTLSLRQLTELAATIRSPKAAVEDEHCGPIAEEARQGNVLALVALQREVRCGCFERDGRSARVEAPGARERDRAQR